MAGIWHNAGCCCGWEVTNCDTDPTVSLWYTPNMDILTDMYPDDFTQGEQFYKDRAMDYQCEAYGWELCNPPFAHDVGEDTPTLWLSYYEEWSKTPKTLLTADFTIRPSHDVHFGVLVFGAWDDAGNIWINETKQIAGFRNTRYSELDNRNCDIGGWHWYVETFDALEPIRVQVAVFDNVQTEVNFSMFMTFWHNGDPVPGDWPAAFRLRIRDNQ